MRIFVKFKNFVDKYKLCFFIGAMAVFIALAFMPYDYINSSYSVSLYQTPLAISYNIKRYNDINAEYYNEYVGFFKNLIVLYSFLAAAIIITILIPAIFYILKRKLTFAFLPVLILVALLLEGTPHIGFYLLLLLTLFEILYYISWIISKRPIKEKPIKIKEPKPKKLSDKERIALLEKEVETLKQKTE